MHVIAGASPDNTPAGYYWTFLFPMLLFIVIALILWALLGRPHQRVPARRVALGLSTRAPGAATAGTLAATAATSTAESAGPADAAPPTPTAEPDASAATDDSGGEQTPADGAGAGE